MREGLGIGMSGGTLPFPLRVNRPCWEHHIGEFPIRMIFLGPQVDTLGATYLLGNRRSGVEKMACQVCRNQGIPVTIAK